MIKREKADQLYEAKLLAKSFQNWVQVIRNKKHKTD